MGFLAPPAPTYKMPLLDKPEMLPAPKIELQPLDDEAVKRKGKASLKAPTLIARNGTTSGLRIGK